VSIVIEREPEWTDEDRDIALAHDDYRRNVHHVCGTHVSKSMDKSVARVVKHEKFVCEDCRAIERYRNKFHRDRKHTDEKCDCDQYVFFVDHYVPVESVPGYVPPT
jgi:hypothetical protein